MRWRGVSHVEFAVLDYDKSIEFYDALFGWLGYDSSTHYGVDTPSTENAFNDALKKVHDHIATCMNQPT